MGEAFLFGLIIGVAGSFWCIDHFYRSTYKTMFETITERFRNRIKELSDKLEDLQNG